MAKITDVDITSLLFDDQGSAPTSPAATKHRLYFKSDGPYYVDSGGTATGPLATASSASIPSGTSFPGTPATNDLYRRTDRGLLYYYDGTRWLTLELYHLPIIPIAGGAPGDVLGATNGAAFRAPVWNAVYDLYIVDWYAMTFVATTNDGTNKWTLTLSKESKAAAYSQTTIDSFSTGTTPDTAGQFIVHTRSINALLGTSSGTLTVGGTKVSAPGNLTSAHAITYRLVG